MLIVDADRKSLETSDSIFRKLGRPDTLLASINSRWNNRYRFIEYNIKHFALFTFGRLSERDVKK